MAERLLNMRYCPRCSPALGRERGLVDASGNCGVVLVHGHKVGDRMMCCFCRDSCDGRVMTDEEAMKWDTDSHAWYWLNVFFYEEVIRRKAWRWSKDDEVAEPGSTGRLLYRGPDSRT